MKSRIQLLILFIVIAGCKKHATETPAPGKATLSFPLDNNVCVNGSGNNGSESAVTFIWGKSTNAQSYELHIKNLQTEIPLQTVNTGQTTVQVSLAVGTPFSWYIISKNGSQSTQSDTWKFYNSGPGITDYAPFPAEDVSPAYGKIIDAGTGTVELEWSGSAVGNNITNYDVYFGTTSTPQLYKASVTGMSLGGVPVQSGQTYYWSITTNDSNGNSTPSEVFQFSTQ